MAFEAGFPTATGGARYEGTGEAVGHEQVAGIQAQEIRNDLTFEYDFTMLAPEVAELSGLGSVSGGTIRVTGTGTMTLTGWIDPSTGQALRTDAGRSLRRRVPVPRFRPGGGDQRRLRLEGYVHGLTRAPPLRPAASVMWATQEHHRRLVGTAGGRPPCAAVLDGVDEVLAWLKVGHPEGKEPALVLTIVRRCPRRPRLNRSCPRARA